jgi:hypothetical protein
MNKLSCQLLTVCVATILLVSERASAVYGVDDFNTIMYRTYTNSRCADHTGEQWANWSWWVNNMLNVAGCYVCEGNSTNLKSELTGSARTSGFNADLIAIDTHGGRTGSGTSHHGWLFDEACSQIDLNTAEPLNTEPEIFLLNACTVFSTSDDENWPTLRNLHRYGAPVSAGCWDLCSLVDTPFSDTWGIIGGEISGGVTIEDAWYDGHDYSFTDDKIIVIGLGTVGAANCGSVADNVTFFNRANYHGPTYGHNQPAPHYSSDPELCGWYWSL